MPLSVRVCPGTDDRSSQLLTDLLSRQADFVIIRCDACLADAPEACAERHPDVLVAVSTSLLRDDCLDTLDHMRRTHPDARLIVLSLDHDDFSRRLAQEHGADAVVPLENAYEELPDAIRLVMA